MANHADLKPIGRVWESSGHEYDEGLLRAALLQRQQAELRAAQREGWVPPLTLLHTVLPSFAPPDGKEEEGPAGTLSTATSGGLSGMDVDDDPAAAVSQEELEAAAAAAAAARLLRRQQRQAEKERRRQQLIQVQLRAVASCARDACVLASPLGE